MNLGSPIALVILGLFAVVAGAWAVHHFFSADARWERRRRRSHTRISSTAKRPMVKFSVRTKSHRRK